MIRYRIIGVTCGILLAVGLWTSLAASPVPPIPTIYFADNFNGPAINPANWNKSLATSGPRWCNSSQVSTGDPGQWLNPATQSCQGVRQLPPDGSIVVANGLATFGSNAAHTFSYIWRGQPSRPSPFPAQGDFTLAVRMRYTKVGGSGAGLVATKWDNTTPSGDNPPSSSIAANGFLEVWDDTNGLRAALENNVNYPVSGDPFGFHMYQLSYTSGTYDLTIDGVLTAQITATGRPNAILIGNPVVAWTTSSPWSQFDVDYIRVTVP